VKLLFENWRRYQTMMERINELGSGKRFVLDKLVEITEEDNKTGLPEDQLEKIKKWAGLSGQAEFLGRGSRGSAFKFGDKVIKITNDPNETKAAALIADQDHPNVYKIDKVGQRSQEDIDNSEVSGRYVIIYDFLDYPTQAMINATRWLHDQVRVKDKAAQFYQWKPEYLSLARKLTKELIHKSKEDPEILGPPHKGYGPPREKITHIANNLGWTDEERRIFYEFWIMDYGENPRKALDTPENVATHAINIFINPIATHFHELAKGLTFLKQNGITFVDLKAPNVMERGGQVAIIDIGYSSVKGAPEIPII
jgi:hypothetical protein